MHIKFITLATNFSACIAEYHQVQCVAKFLLEQLNAYQDQAGSLHEIFIYKMSFFLTSFRINRFHDSCLPETDPILRNLFSVAKFITKKNNPSHVFQ